MQVVLDELQAARLMSHVAMPSPRAPSRPCMLEV
jgi:hypothetical protein